MRKLVRRAAGVSVAAALCAGFGASAAQAAGSATATMRSHGRTISVDVMIDHFAVHHGRTIAVATAASRVRTRDGRVRAASQKVTLSVKQGATCRILDLSLQKLRLTLLGLTVDTSALNLHVTGDRTGSLGKLFCALAQSLKLSNAAQKANVARLMNHGMHGRRMHAMSFRAALPKAAAAQAPGAATCPVLSLTLGPLNLYLLGLRVDLYGPTSKTPVVVTIDADPNGGALGALFCKLAQSSGA